MILAACVLVIVYVVVADDCGTCSGGVVIVDVTKSRSVVLTLFRSVLTRKRKHDVQYFTKQYCLLQSR